ncbi:hypothetical protein ACH5RR_009458 [Cinchona calisaya]|uniref:Reverse transcriptase n=1 Tax=Cinchona calisaya TaxID=153742 RepID=A0ABD3AEC2_9GENT
MFRVHKKIKVCRIMLLNWNRSLNINAGKEMKWIKGRIMEVKEGVSEHKREEIVELKRKLSLAYKNEEVFWSRRAKVAWLNEEDKNNKFFHASVVERRRMNQISQLRRCEGEWCKTEQEIQEEIIQCFNKIFNSSQPEDFGEILHGIPKTISEQMNEKLVKPVTEIDIKDAVFSMHSHNSLGPDGISPLFFQKF